MTARYRSIAGDVCDAVILEQTDDYAMLDVITPGTGERVRLRAKWNGNEWEKTEAKKWPSSSR